MMANIATTDSNTSDHKVEVEGKTFEIHFDGEMEFTVTEECVYGDRWGSKYETKVEYTGEFDASGLYALHIVNGEVESEIDSDSELFPIILEAFEGWANDTADMLEDLAADRL